MASCCFAAVVNKSSSCGVAIFSACTRDSHVEATENSKFGNTESAESA